MAKASIFLRPLRFVLRYSFDIRHWSFVILVSPVAFLVATGHSDATPSPVAFPGGDPMRCPLASLSLLTVLALLPLLTTPVRADDWPQWLGPQRDGVWRETGI